MEAKGKRKVAASPAVVSKSSKSKKAKHTPGYRPANQRVLTGFRVESVPSAAVEVKDDDDVVAVAAVDSKEVKVEKEHKGEESEDKAQPAGNSDLPAFADIASSSTPAPAMKKHCVHCERFRGATATSRPVWKVQAVP